MNCKNCNNILKDTQKFCDECGAKVIQNRLKPKVLAQQVNEQFICVDNKFLRTFIDLFRRPEAVIVGYINGTRRKYIDVLQYFAISLTLLGIQVFLMSTFFKESIEFGDEFMRSFNKASATKNDYLKDFNFESINKYQSLIYIFTVPFSALGTWLAYYLLGTRTYNFTEHLVINLYYYAQYIIITAILSILFLLFGLDYLIVSSAIQVLTFFYLFHVLKRVFKTTFWETFARLLFVMAIYVISMLIIALIVLILWVIIALVFYK